MSWTWLYPVVAGFLVVFGFLGLFSIGAPFLLTGIVMLVLFPWRRRPALIWPGLAGVWGLVLGYVLVAPIGCRATPAPSTAPERSVTVCDGILVDYQGIGSYSPSLAPALLIGIAVAVIAAVAVRLALRRARADLAAS